MRQVLWIIRTIVIKAALWGFIKNQILKCNAVFNILKKLRTSSNSYVSDKPSKTSKLSILHHYYVGDTKARIMYPVVLDTPSMLKHWRYATENLRQVSLVLLNLMIPRPLSPNLTPSSSPRDREPKFRNAMHCLTYSYSSSWTQTNHQAVSIQMFQAYLARPANYLLFHHSWWWC